MISLLKKQLVPDRVLSRSFILLFLLFDNDVEFHEKKNFFFDFTSFLCLDFFKFSGPLRHALVLNNQEITKGNLKFHKIYAFTFFHCNEEKNFQAGHHKV